MEIASIFGSRLESLFDLDTVRSSEKCVWAFKMSRPMRFIRILMKLQGKKIGVLYWLLTTWGLANDFTVCRVKYLQRKGKIEKKHNWETDRGSSEDRIVTDVGTETRHTFCGNNSGVEVHTLGSNLEMYFMIYIVSITYQASSDCQ